MSSNANEMIRSFLAENLGIGPKNLVGVDIGSSSVKVCELTHSKKGYKLMRFSMIPLPEETFIDDEIQKHDELVEALEKALQQARVKSPFSAVGVWGGGVISKRIQVPVGTAEEIEDQVMWESEQYIPFDVDASTISFHVLGENVGGGADVLIAAAKNEVVDRFKVILEEAGTLPKVIDLNQFAIANTFSYVCKKELMDAKAPMILLDFGAHKTNVIIFRGPHVSFTRELNIGGAMITDEIQRAMGLSYEEVEDLKINGDANGNLPEEIVDVIDASLGSFIAEIKKTLNFYMTATGEDQFQRCYITGGSSLLPGLLENVEAQAEVETLYFNPFEKLDFDKKAFTDDVLSVIASGGNTAIGLAMRTLSS